MWSFHQFFVWCSSSTNYIIIISVIVWRWHHCQGNAIIVFRSSEKPDPDISEMWFRPNTHYHFYVLATVSTVLILKHLYIYGLYIILLFCLFWTMYAPVLLVYETKQSVVKLKCSITISSLSLELWRSRQSYSIFEGVHFQCYPFIVDEEAKMYVDQCLCGLGLR